MTHTAIVPCAGCTACCRGEAIMLHPEHGDRPEEYETEEVRIPSMGIQGLALKHKPNGDCIYLGDSGCTIHDRAPVICREFDCRRFAKMIGNRAARRQAASNSDVVRAGLERMKTL